MRCKTTILLAALSGGAAIGLSSPPPPVNPSQSVTKGNLTFTASLGLNNAFTWPEKISGTDNWLTLGAKVTRFSASEQYYSGQLYKAKLVLGGNVVGAPSGTNPQTCQIYDDSFVLGTPPPPPASLEPIRGPSVFTDEYTYPQERTPRQVRFASNHFEHDSTLRVTLVLTFALFVLDNGQPSRLASSEDVEVTVQGDIAVWNRGLRYRPKYSADGQLWSPQHAFWINELINMGQSRMSDAGYGWPLNEPQFQSKSGPTGILADLAQVNGMFINAHGEANGVGGSTADGFHDSFGYQPGSTGPNDPVTFMTSAEVLTALGGLTTPPRTPPVNVVFMYACLIGSWSTIPIADAFFLKQLNSACRDSAAYCFESPVWPLVLTPSELIQTPQPKPRGFKVHAQYLLDRLNEGYTAGKAYELVENAWVVLTPDGPRWKSAGFQMFGDELTTTRCVYHPQLEVGQDTNLPSIYRTGSSTYGSWFAVFPKAVTGS